MNKITEDTTYEKMDILTAQQSFHEMLVQKGFRGKYLLEILNAHVEWIRGNFLNFTSIKYHDLHVTKNLTEEQIMDHTKHQLAHQLADMLIEKSTVHVYKHLNGTEVQMNICLFTGDLYKKMTVAIIPKTIFVPNPTE